MVIKGLHFECISLSQGVQRGIRQQLFYLGKYGLLLARLHVCDRYPDGFVQAAATSWGVLCPLRFASDSCARLKVHSTMTVCRSGKRFTAFQKASQ